MNHRRRALVLTLLFSVVGYFGCSSHSLVPREYEALLFENRLPQQKPLDEAKSALEQELKKKEQWALEDCFQLALLYNDRLHLAGENYLQAIATKEKALAQISPTLDVRETYSGLESSPLPGIFPLTQHTRWLALNVPLFSGFRDIHTLHQANENIVSQEATLHYEKSSVLALVADAFYQVLKVQATLDTLNSLIRTQQERLRQMQERQKVGLARKTEVMLIEADLANAQAQRSRAQGDLEIAKAHLSVVLGCPMRQSLIDKQQETKFDSLDTLIQQAYLYRQDLRSLEKHIAMADEQISIVLGEYLPTLSFLGDYYLFRDRLMRDVDWDILLSADWPLFSGGSTQAHLKEAHSQLRQARTAYEQQKKSIAEEVTQAFYTYQSLGQEYVFLEKSAKLTEENYAMSQEEYKQGLATNLEVQLIYLQLIDAKLALDQAKWNRKVAFTQIRFAAGQLK